MVQSCIGLYSYVANTQMVLYFNIVLGYVVLALTLSDGITVGISTTFSLSLSASTASISSSMYSFHSGFYFWKVTAADTDTVGSSARRIAFSICQGHSLRLVLLWTQSYSFPNRTGAGTS